MAERDQRADTLSKFLECSLDSAIALANAMHMRRYSSRGFLSQQGDADRLLWLILEGTVQLQALSAEGQATVISAFGPGELIGGRSDDEERPYGIQALGEVVALEINALHLRELLREWPELAVGLSRIYSGQLDTVLDRLAARVTLSAMGRFYRELLRLAGPSDTVIPSPVIAALALSAQTTRETGSRAINALERRGIIARDQSQLTIVSRRMLEELIV